MKLCENKCEGDSNGGGGYFEEVVIGFDSQCRSQVAALNAAAVEDNGVTGGGSRLG
jgi:hypothetical protein